MRTLVRSAVGILAACAAVAAQAQSVTLTRSAEPQARRIDTRVTTRGKVFANVGAGKTAEHELAATAAFTFVERSLPAGGRDALALRAVREFSAGTMETTIGDRRTTVELPAAARLVVASGDAVGVQSYAINAALTREAVDLLELPGDPLALEGILPPRAVEPGGAWSPADWAVQMLAAIEAMESAKLTCTLTEVNGDVAIIAVDGSAKGQRQGTNVEIGIRGTLEFEIAAGAFRGAKLVYKVKSAIGAVSPGLEADVAVQMRSVAASGSGRLTDEFVGQLPIAAPAGALDLAFDAAPWGVRLRHPRDWFLFHAVLDGSPQVAILRLLDRGSLIAQCNLSPVPAAKAGQHTPLDQFEADIRASLGSRLKDITAREEVSLGTGFRTFRVVAEGGYSLKNAQGDDLKIPAHWIYYLCAAPNGQQVSFVFAVESNLLEQLGSRDEELVQQLQFIAERNPTPSRAASRPDAGRP
ncbi:MAG: hypothetical protein KF774_07525 [Planctomyces sp.]|nr:hypothetical protein [Planctomyces sp.]